MERSGTSHGDQSSDGGRAVPRSSRGSTAEIKEEDEQEVEEGEGEKKKRESDMRKERRTRKRERERERYRHRHRQHCHRAPPQPSSEAAARPQFNDGSQRDDGCRTANATTVIALLTW